VIKKYGTRKDTDKWFHITIPCANDDCVKLINEISDVIEKMGQIVSYLPQSGVGQTECWYSILKNHLKVKNWTSF